MLVLSLLLLLLVGLVKGGIWLWNQTAPISPAAVEPVQAAPPAPAPEPVAAAPVKPLYAKPQVATSRLNVLLLGVDDGEYGIADAPKRSDTMILANIDTETGIVTLVSLPRDTQVLLPGHKEVEKLGHAYAYGGPALTVKAVEDLLQIPVNYYVTLHWQGFIRCVDSLGGVDLYVEQDMDYEDPEAQLTIHIVKGYQHMDGDTAQKYLRYRGGELGDIGRLQRQQHFVKAFYESLLQPDTVTRLPALVEICRNRITTSAELFDTAHLTVVLRKLSTNEPQVIMLPGAESQADPTLWLPDQEKIAAKVEELFPLPAEEP